MSEEASHVKKVIRATKGYRPQSCSMYGNEYTDIAAKMKKVINVLENDKECLARIGGSIKNLETDLTQLNKFQIAQKKKDQQISISFISFGRVLDQGLNRRSGRTTSTGERKRKIHGCCQ